ncbi:MAG: CHAT domain-containing protein [Planctomycetota bacterium]
MNRFLTTPLLAVTAVVCLAASGRRCSGQIPGDTTPSRIYFAAVEEIYRGEFRDAQRQFNNELRGGIRLGPNARWLDSICYYSMLGEVLYQQGSYRAALDQFNSACAMYLENPKWLLRLRNAQEPRADSSLARRPPPWGQRTRSAPLSRLPEQLSMSLGQFDNSGAAQRGGVVRPPQIWRLNAAEVVRCTAHAIRRRNELLGPLARHSPLSGRLATELGSGAATPNHWSNAWVQLQLGLAYMGTGEFPQAQRALERAVLLRGRFDHVLTGSALLGQAELAMRTGNTQLASALAAEASFAAFYYDDFSVLDDAFRLGASAHFATATQGVSPVWNAAAGWASRERLGLTQARLALTLADDLLRVGQADAASKALATGTSRMREAAVGPLGARALWLEGRVLQTVGRNAEKALGDAVRRQVPASVRNFQIQLANEMFDRRELSTRAATEVYEELLAKPVEARWGLAPLDSLAMGTLPQAEAFDRWVLALVTRKQTARALEAADLAKRRRFLAALPWGGRLLALRSVLEGNERSLSPEALNQRNEALLRWPAYAELADRGATFYERVDEQWMPGMPEKELQSLVRPWRGWAESLADREALLRRIGTSRVTASQVYPPWASVEQMRELLGPRQAVVVLHETSGGLLASLVTQREVDQWNAGTAGSLSRLVREFLEDHGLRDNNRAVDTETLRSDYWLESGGQLYDQLFANSDFNSERFDEVAVVPDGALWYVPWNALPAPTEEGREPLGLVCRVRVTPLASLAVGRSVPWHRVKRSLVAVSEDALGGSEGLVEEAREALRDASEQAVEVPKPTPVASPVLASSAQSLISLAETEIKRGTPLAWAPLPIDRPASRGELSAWLELPQGPQRVITPTTATAAGQGGRSAGRARGATPPGSELFVASCALLADGAQTVLLSQWRVGGRSTVDLVREFTQELPYTSAADALQRSIELTRERQIDISQELRVKSGKGGGPLTGGHPFFWGGYLLIDLGAPGELEEPAEPNDRGEAKAAAL